MTDNNPMLHDSQNTTESCSVTSNPSNTTRNEQREQRRTMRNEQRQTYRQRPVRRAGSITMGIALIACGIAITLYYIIPGFNLIALAKFAPLILVCLGIEILWANARKGDALLKYDLLSMFLCFMLICGSAGVSLIPAVWQFYGPERSRIEARLQSEMEETLYNRLSTENIKEARVNLTLTDSNLNPNMTLSDLSAADYLNVSITFADDFTDATNFATACRSVLDKLNDSGIQQFAFYAQNDTDQWELWIDNIFQRNASVEQLTQEVSHNIYYFDGSEYYWLTEDEIAQREAQLAQQQQEQTEPAPEESAESTSEVYSEGESTEPQAVTETVVSEGV